MTGQFGLELHKNAARDYSFLVNVQKDLGVTLENDLGERMMVGLGKSTPTMELRLDGNAKQVTGAIDFGALTVSGPLNAFRDTFDPEQYDDLTGEPIPRTTYTGALELLVAGLEGALTFDGSTDHLTLEHLGIGDQTSSLKLDGTTLASLDLNPSDGRHFDLSYQKSPTGDGSLLTFSPTFDLSLLLHFAPLLSQIPDLSPSVLDENLKIWFDGTDPSIDTSNGQIAVVSGTLNVTSASTPSANVTVPAGMCLVDSGVASGNELIGSLGSGACE